MPAVQNSVFPDWPCFANQAVFSWMLFIEKGDETGGKEKETDLKETKRLKISEK